MQRKIQKFLLIFLILTVSSCGYINLQEPMRHIQNNDYEKARISLEKIKVKKPGKAKVHFALGDVYGQLDLYNDMVREFTVAKKYNPGYVSRIENRKDYYWIKNYNKAIKSLKSKDYISAKQYFKNCIFLRPMKREAHLGIGRCFFYLDSLVLASSAFENALDIVKDWQTMSNLSEIYFRIGNYEKSVLLCNEILKLSPNNSKAVLMRAYSYESIKKYQEAIEDFKKYLSFKKNDYEVIIHLSQLLEINKNYLESLKFLRQAYILSEDKISVAKLAGKVCFQAHFFDEMLKWYSLIINKYPNDIEAKNNLVIAYQALGFKDKAAEINNEMKNYIK